MSRSAACLWLVLSTTPASGGPMAFPGKEWQVVPPDDEGIDAAKLRAAIDALKAGVGRDGVSEMLIVRRGRVVWHGDGIDKVHGIWSCTKSFTSTVLGLLIEDGKCALDTRAADLVPKLKGKYPGVTLRHFATMTSGYRAAGDAEAKGGYLHGPSTTPFEPAEPVFAPGAKFAYWDSAMNTFGLALTAAAGEPLEAVLKRRVLDPIGADSSRWKWGDRGTAEVAGGRVKVNSGSGNAGGHVQISARELARFGHLFLNRGSWNGKQLVPAKWVEQATRVQVPADLPDGFPKSNIPGSGVYGFNWWVNGMQPDGKRRWPDAPAGTYAAVGHNNNRLWVVPEWQMVVVRLGLDQADRRLTPEAENEFFKLLARALEKREAAAEEKPVRIASGVSGHIHPAACVTKRGTVLVVFSQSDFKDLRLTRSADGGRTWSEPAPFPHAEKLSIYPGSLTALADGRVVHAWNTWYADPRAKGGKSRFVQLSVSGDDGKTWSEPKALAKAVGEHSVIRHPILELAPAEWLFPLMDRTVVYDPTTGKETPFGDGREHGLVPIVRTPKGTLVSGAGLRSTDGGRTWQKVTPFPQITENGWRFELVALSNGWLLAGEVQGPGVGGERWRYVASRDDGASWDFGGAFEFYGPGRAIGGRACPRTVELDRGTIGTAFYDTEAKQAGGAGVFFLRTPLAKLGGKGRAP